jgi:hypothetical protein
VKKPLPRQTRERLFGGLSVYNGRNWLLIALFAHFAFALGFDAAGVRAVFAGGLGLVAAGLREHGGCEEGEREGGNSEEFCDVHSSSTDRDFQNICQREIFNKR